MKAYLVPVGNIVAWENQSTWEKACPSVSFSTTNFKRTDLELNPVYPGWQAGRSLECNAGITGQQQTVLGSFQRRERSG